MKCECGNEIVWKEEWYAAPDPITGRLMECRVYRCDKCGLVYEERHPMIGG